MEPSKTGSTENKSTQSETRSRNVIQRGDPLPVKQTVRTLLSVEAVSFFIASLVHAGIFVHGYEHQEAMIAESVIGAVLLGGLVMTWIRPRSISSIAVVVQAFALLGTFVGIWTIIVGIGPGTVPDIVYHVVIVLVLTIGIIAAWRSRGTKPT